MENNFDDFESGLEKRPTFLTVLCILTFIGSGWAIISSAWAYTTAHKMVNMINHNLHENNSDSLSRKDSVNLERGRNNKDREFGEKIGMSMKSIMTVDNIQKRSIGDIIAALFTLGGAILMWFQKRKGFYLYVAGIIISIALPLYLYGGNLIAVGITSFSAFFGLLFIALYAVNWKSLR